MTEILILSKKSFVFKHFLYIYWSMSKFSSTNNESKIDGYDLRQKAIEVRIVNYL